MQSAADVPTIPRQLKSDRIRDDLRALMAAAGGWSTTPEIVRSVSGRVQSEPT